MSILNPCAQRVREPEVMDDPSLDGDQHIAALNGLARLNWLSASTRIVWRPIARMARASERPLRVLDVATGSGDIPLGLWRRSQRAGVQLDLHGVDISERALEFARQRANRAGAQVTFSSRDVLNQPLPTDFDVIVSSLFLHHLDRGDAVKLLQSMADGAGQLVLVNDLLRSGGGLLLAKIASHLFTTSRVVHTDAALSVKAAFTMDEAREMANDAGMASAEVRSVWPYRFLLHWRRP